MEINIFVTAEFFFFYVLPFLCDIFYKNKSFKLLKKQYSEQNCEVKIDICSKLRSSKYENELVF